MDYLPGPDLASMDLKPTVRDMWHYSRQLISALYTCHEQANILHRDLKPDNLILNSEG
jgi:serine/threonine protein kinase